MNIDHLKYPVGRLSIPKEKDTSKRNAKLNFLKSFPTQLQSLCSDLSIDELNLIYRPEGWNIKQVIHHMADSHMNCVMRIKWTLTEDKPLIKAYNQTEWAKLSISNYDAISFSIDFLQLVHRQIFEICSGLTETQLQRSFTHPEGNIVYTIEDLIYLYNWHSRHHYAHITQALKYQGNFENVI